MSKESKKRVIEIENALIGSYEVMRNLAIDFSMVKKLNLELKKYAKGAIANDLKVSAEFLKTAFKTSLDTAQINIAYMHNLKKVKLFKKELKNIKETFNK